MRSSVVSVRSQCRTPDSPLLPVVASSPLLGAAATGAPVSTLHRAKRSRFQKVAGRMRPLLSTAESNPASVRKSQSVSKLSGLVS
jgi:hypothetical protein